MHILMTTDTVGGVWSYTRELVSGLVRHGHQVTLISFGKVPSQEQAVWMQGLGDFEYRATGFRLLALQPIYRACFDLAPGAVLVPHQE